MQITLSFPEFGRKERNLYCDVVHITTKWAFRLTLDHAIAAIQTSRPLTIYCASYTSCFRFIRRYVWMVDITWSTSGHVGPVLPCALLKVVSVPEMNYMAEDGCGEVHSVRRNISSRLNKFTGITLPILYKLKAVWQYALIHIGSSQCTL